MSAPSPAAGVPLEPLSRAAFAPFGDAVRSVGGDGRDVNLGTARRFDHAAALENARAAAAANVAVFRCAPQSLPFAVTLLERHPHSTQLFAALEAARWLVIVAPTAADGSPDVSGLRAFVAGRGDVVNLRRGVWHHPVIALDGPAELLMLAYEDGGAGDCEERALPSPLRVG